MVWGSDNSEIFFIVKSSGYKLVRYAYSESTTPTLTNPYFKTMDAVSNSNMYAMLTLLIDGSYLWIGGAERINNSSGQYNGYLPTITKVSSADASI